MVVVGQRLIESPQLVVRVGQAPKLVLHPPPLHVDFLGLPRGKSMQLDVVVAGEFLKMRRPYPDHGARLRRQMPDDLLKGIVDGDVRGRHQQHAPTRSHQVLDRPGEHMRLAGPRWPPHGMQTWLDARGVSKLLRRQETRWISLRADRHRIQLARGQFVSQRRVLQRRDSVPQLAPQILERKRDGPQDVATVRNPAHYLNPEHAVRSTGIGVPRSGPCLSARQSCSRLSAVSGLPLRACRSRAYQLLSPTGTTLPKDRHSPCSLRLDLFRTSSTASMSPRFQPDIDPPSSACHA